MISKLINRVLRQSETVHLAADTPNGDALVAFLGADNWRAARAECDDDGPALKRLLEHLMLAWNIELLERLGVPLPPGADEFVMDDPAWFARAVERKRRLFGADPRLFIDAKVMRGEDGDLEVHAMVSVVGDEWEEPPPIMAAEAPRLIAARIASDRTASSRQRRKREKDARRKQRGR